MSASEQPIVHTPGPWFVSQYASHHPFAGYPAEVGQHDDLGCDANDVCKINRIGNKQSEWANAYLIAAAPEILESLESLIELYEQDDETTTPGTDAYTAMTLAKIVVAKARGTLVV